MARVFFGVEAPRICMNGHVCMDNRSARLNTNQILFRMHISRADNLQQYGWANLFYRTINIFPELVLDLSSPKDTLWAIFILTGWGLRSVLPSDCGIKWLSLWLVQSIYRRKSKLRSKVLLWGQHLFHIFYFLKLFLMADCMTATISLSNFVVKVD